MFELLFLFKIQRETNKEQNAKGTVPTSHFKQNRNVLKNFISANIQLLISDPCVLPRTGRQDLVGMKKKMADKQLMVDPRLSAISSLQQ